MSGGTYSRPRRFRRTTTTSLERESIIVSPPATNSSSATYSPRRRCSIRFPSTEPVHGLGKVPLSFQIVWNWSCPRDSLAIAEAFVVSKEEGLILPQRPAYRSSELVLLQRRFCGGE